MISSFLLGLLRSLDQARVLGAKLNNLARPILMPWGSIRAFVPAESTDGALSRRLLVGAAPIDVNLDHLLVLIRTQPWPGLGGDVGRGGL